MSFDDNQRSYYLREINRALPVGTGGGVPDDSTIALALGNVDPVMPGAAGAPATTEARQFLSYYGSNAAAYANDAACRQITNPLQMRGDPSVRTGCGWYFRNDPNMASTAAYGTRRAPMAPTLDSAGAGQWIWDPMEAALMESQKAAAKITSCPMIQYSAYPNMGWCPSTNSALPTDGMGNALFPRAPGGDCPGGGIVTSVSQCPPPPGSGGGAGGGGGGAAAFVDPCAPTASGTLTPACLTMLAQQTGLSPAGALIQAVASGDWSTVQALMQIVGRSVSWDMTTKDGWLTACQQIKGIADTTQGRVGGAAGAIVYNSAAFDPCALQPTDGGPFADECVARIARNAGWSPSGTSMPGGPNYGSWPTAQKWQDMLNYASYMKSAADTPGFNGLQPQDQSNAINQVYGTTVQYPKTDCNNKGVMLYRYFFPPTWNWSLFPAQGPQTHFLGRYIFKQGLPSTEGGQSVATSVPWANSTVKDQAPSGGNLTEAHRLECNFQVQQTDTHQFQVQVDDMCNMYIDGQQYMSIGCCGVLQNGPVLNWNAGEVHKLTWVYVNGGGPWSFGCHLSVGGQAFTPIPAAQTFMTQDRRKPTLGLEFARAAAGTSPITDTNNVLTNWEFVNNCQIGQAYGQNCMVFTNGGGLHNFHTYAQGIGSHALRSMTCRLYVDSATVGNTGAWPSIWSFANFSGSQPAANPRQGPAPESWDWQTRQDDFSMVLNPNGVATFGAKSNQVGLPWQTAQYANIPIKQWFHLAVVWDDDWQGFAMYVNGQLADHKRLSAPITSVLLEQICIGGDATDDGASWTGGMAWWRGFDYRLSTDQITLDMNDNWSSLY